ncbi:MAG: phosphoribosylformylglycinamidine synthase I [Dehalococcoidia bacterium]|nr:phosphoribosylformylglycinamidine synthase I [Dehalococcoidia bacterium]
MNIGIVVFPGTWSEKDCFYSLSNINKQFCEFIWHKDEDINLENFDAIVLPGGFSYGDFLRSGSIASLSPIMKKIKIYADEGNPIIGICNGFQILCESNLLPGTLIRNNNLQFRCEWSNIKVTNDETIFTSSIKKNEILSIPISHGEGNYYADKKTIDELENNNQIIFRYSDDKGYIDQFSNPNGSINNIAGIINKEGNILGMMPHPEKACEEIIGGADGNLIFQSLINSYNRPV